MTTASRSRAYQARYAAAARGAPPNGRNTTGWNLAVGHQINGLSIEEALELVSVYRSHIFVDMDDRQDARENALDIYQEQVYRVYGQVGRGRSGNETYLQMDFQAPVHWESIGFAPFPREYASKVANAQEMHRRGFNVLPEGEEGRVVHGTKHPLLIYREFQTDRAPLARVMGWWMAYPSANACLLLGRSSRFTPTNPNDTRFFIALDFDSYDAFVRHPQASVWLVNTPCIRTRRGVHVIMVADELVYFTKRFSGPLLDVKGSESNSASILMAPGSEWERDGRAGTYYQMNPQVTSIMSFASGAAHYVRDVIEAMPDEEEVPVTPRRDVAPLPHVADDTHQHITKEQLDATDDLVRDDPDIDWVKWLEWKRRITDCARHTKESVCRDNQEHKRRDRMYCSEKGCGRYAYRKTREFMDAHRADLERIKALGPVAFAVQAPYTHAMTYREMHALATTLRAKVRRRREDNSKGEDSIRGLIESSPLELLAHTTIITALGTSLDKPCSATIIVWGTGFDEADVRASLPRLRGRPTEGAAYQVTPWEGGDFDKFVENVLWSAMSGYWVWWHPGALVAWIKESKGLQHTTSIHMETVVDDEGTERRRAVKGAMAPPQPKRACLHCGAKVFETSHYPVEENEQLKREHTWVEYPLLPGVLITNVPGTLLPTLGRDNPERQRQTTPRPRPERMNM